MSNRIRRMGLRVLCVAGVCLAGCFPDDSLEWSDDGSFGLLRVKGTLFLVDAQNERLTSVEPDGVSVMPDISADGRQIAYVKGFAYESVGEGLRLLPPTVAQMIQDDARQLERKVLAGFIAPSDLPADKDEKLDYMEPYVRWVVRCMCDKPGSALAEKLGPGKLAECRRREIGFSRLILANRTDLQNKKTLVTMPVAMYRPRFSPDGRHIAYVMPTPQDEEKGILLVASVDGKVDALEVAGGVAVGYDWRPDSKALAYIRQDGDPILGVLEEKVVIGDDGVPFTKPIDTTKENSVGTSRTMHPGRQFAGTLFQPTIHVAYGLDGRILLSSAAAAIPTAELDEPKISLFCYDRVTGTVTDILPGALRNQANQNMNFFRLSPDGKRLLVPLKHNRFAIYELGSNDAVFPCEQDEGFGLDEMPDFLPSWKGNDQITALVSEKSHLLVGRDEQPAHRKEIVVIGTRGQLRSVLSKDWPDDAIPKDLQDEADSTSKRGL